MKGPMTVRLLAQASRHFSNSARVCQLVKAPIQVYGVEGRYAHALFSAASKQKQLDSVADDLAALQKLIKQEERLKSFLSDPVMKKNEKRTGMSKILKAAGCCDLTSNFIGVMVDNGRLKKTADVCTAFEKIMSAHRGEVVCHVTTAKELSKRDHEELVTALKGFLEKDQILVLNVAVDEALVGGMVVEIGDKFIDMSISAKIKLYSRIIRETAL